MPSPDFINPLSNPIFLPFIERTAFLFVIGFLLILISNRLEFKGLFKTNLGERYFGWLILTPIYLAGIFAGRIPGLLVLLIFVYLAIREISVVAKLPSAYKFTLIALAVWSLFLTSYYTQYFYSLPLFYFVVLTLVAIRMNDGERGFYHVAISLFASIWIIFGISHFVLLGHLNNTIDNTRSLLLLIILAVSLSDIGAYVFGRLFHKLNFLDAYRIAPNISPNKTYVGILGHIIGAGIGIYVMYFALGKYLPLYQWLIVTVLIGVFSMVGGMTNSLFKRYYQIKDSSQLIPGHGGVLDRIDSTVRVVVVLYYYFLFIF